MLIIITLAILAVGSTLTMTIYSVFMPFIENLGEIQNRNIAYYGALGSIERGQLTLRYHKAGFEGSGGWFGSNDFGHNSDKISNNFSLLSSLNNGMKWEIQSRTDGKIPKAGESNIPLEFRYNNSTEPSSNYNKLGYNISESFPLDIDNTTNTGNYYTSNITYGNNFINEINLTLRVPPNIYKGFGGSSSKQANLKGDFDIVGDGIENDIIINRSINGQSSIPNDCGKFTILPNIDVNYNDGTINNKDTAIREKNIIQEEEPDNNHTKNIVFGSTMNPNKTNPDSDLNNINVSNPLQQNIIANESFCSLTGKNFKEIFNNAEGIRLNLSLVNKLKTDYSFLSNTYPFLEYKLDAGTEIPDRFFHIKGTGKVGDYKVIIKTKKPAIKRTGASDFTIIF